jgi:F-type H+-transporting ATPase subunit delta
MSKILSLTSGVPGRYATALFMLCKEKGQLKDLEEDNEKLDQVVSKSKDFKNLIASPIYERQVQSRVVSAISKKIKLHKNTENLLKLMAIKGRIYLIPQLIRDIDALLENEREEIGVEIISAEALSKDHTSKLEKMVNKMVNKKAKIHTRLDGSLIGGMIVKIGSKMIDTSIKSKLMKLQNIMKEVN